MSRPVGFYTDEKRRVRPITPSSGERKINIFNDLNYNEAEDYESAVSEIFADLFGRKRKATTAYVRAIGVDIPELIESIRIVKSYNEFEGENVADELMELYKQGFISELVFGREYSPVIYIRPATTVEQFDREWRFKYVRDKLMKHRPDEAGFAEKIGDPFIHRNYDIKYDYVRVWWD
ncbi:MAG: hypothetical protein QXP04_01230 [Candidatus Nanoarchaeia archaeon]|nr:hypothetical protein [Candidatus Jingweiarchaeum tengchongense]